MQVLGFVLGVVFGFIVAFSAMRSMSRSPWLAWGFVAACVGASIAVLAVKSLRTAGAGLLAGMAVGVITLAGVCGGVIGMLVIQR
jgi:hypothetical protein